MSGSRDSSAGAWHSVEIGDDAAWDSFLAGHQEATIYHTRIWARIIRRAFPRVEDRSRWIETDEGRTALPLFAWKRLGGTGRRFNRASRFSMADPSRAASEAGISSRSSSGRRRAGRSSLILVSNPFGPAPAREEIRGATASSRERSARELPRGVEVETDCTQILTLPTRFEEYWDHTLTTAKRNDVRRLAKKGVMLRCGGSDAEIAAVYGFYRSSFARWGGRPGFVYPEDLYRAMIDLGGENARLYLAEFEGRIIGGAFILRWNGRAHYHAGYFDHEASPLRPNVLLQERIIRDAITDGYTAYDFLPSGGNPGVEAFKESLGGVRVPIERHLFRPPVHRLLRILRGSPRGRGSPASGIGRTIAGSPGILVPRAALVDSNGRRDPLRHGRQRGSTRMIFRPSVSRSESHARVRGCRASKQAR